MDALGPSDPPPSAAPYARPPFEPRLVARRLHAGRAPVTEAEVLALKELGITHVLDLREETEGRGSGRGGAEAIAAMTRLRLRRESVPIPDTEWPKDAALSAAVDALEAHHANRRRRTYLCSRAGLRRTSAVLIAWRAWTEGEPFDLIVERLAELGWPLEPLFALEIPIREWVERRRWELAGLRTPNEPPLPPDPQKELAELQRRMRRTRASRDFGGETAESARARLAGEASPCPACGRPATDLVWCWYESPRETWVHLCGRAGWSTVCPDCLRDVELFMEVIS